MRHTWVWSFVAAGLGLLALGAARSRARGLGVIVAPGMRYTPTRGDWLWLARMASAESDTYDGQAAVIWALIARFAARTQMGVAPGTLGAFAQAFSPPTRRAPANTRSWSWFETNEPALLELVNAFAAGDPPPAAMPRATNWAACWADHSCRTWEAAGNCFCASPELEGEVDVVQG